MKTLSILVLTLAILCFGCKKTTLPDESGDSFEQTSSRRSPLYLQPNSSLLILKNKQGSDIFFHKVGELTLTEGDICLTTEQIDFILKTPKGSYLQERTAVTPLMNGALRHWPNGTIPFVIDEDFSEDDRDIILAAIGNWETGVSSLNFVERTNQTNYILFAPSTGNNSYVGMIGGEQKINLIQDPTWGVDITAAMHEIGHAIGFYHEQSRSDRDNFIVVNWDNIRPNMQHNFRTYVERNIPGLEIGTFDFGSIMLYPSFINDENFVFDTGIPAMERLNGDTWFNNWFLSNGDIETGQLLYGPPFAKVRYVYYEDYSDTESYVSADIYIDFFADAALTIPTTINTPKWLAVTTISETYYTYTWGPPSVSKHVISVPANTSSILIDENFPLEHIRYDYGNIVTGSSRQSKEFSAGFLR
ncbi:MAG: M12 family metallopeptidase [Chitinophagaceae bacterium]